MDTVLYMTDGLLDIFLKILTVFPYAPLTLGKLIWI